MRKLSPAILAAAVGLALSTGALAQVRTTTTASGTTITATTAPRTTTNTTTSGSTAGGTTFGFTSVPSETNHAENVRSTAPTASVTTGGTTSSGSTSGTGGTGGTGSTNGTGASSTNAPSTGAGFGVNRNTAETNQFLLNNRVTPNTLNATPPGAALGRSEGQTSAGTAGAISSAGVTGPTFDLVGTDVGAGITGGVDTNVAGTIPGAVVVPGVTSFAGTGFTGGMDASGVNVNGERVGNGGADFRANVAASTPTPIFDQAARRGAARDAARRARGEEPRIIGLAPRTERDLTHQMPDDPIIRY